MYKYYFPRTTRTASVASPLMKASTSETPDFFPAPVVKFPASAGASFSADTVRLFVEALRVSKLDEAKAYISKNYVRDFDLPELSAYFSENYKYKRLQKAEFNSRPKNCITNSILVQENNKSSIIHLHMIKELGAWKIYDIDKE